ncbi:PP-loop superfamily ATP-utilizing enzyme [Galbibacter orientalis DSM 19592]|uniref:PP-loop superfamily ATP-utilizing enzyme n=1 Tax=Galbibacter orientalis DSM 19592 TaxID=926559 RepID=I3C772_9FLAO|nr:diphthine--ammonia ligase [Galbibacter orientalis]EIJ39465.1 PP-loop superfamily ATP-utilizing enzyme [Galbibacter orientalis DSM 19592]
MSNKTYFNWSTGKDSALALYKTLQNPLFDIAALVTTVNSDMERVSMHGLRNELLLKQAKSIEIPLKIISLSGNVSMATYDETMKTAMNELKSEGFTHTVFGDIFLEDLKQYREQKLNEVGIQAEFPLWKENTKNLLEEFISLGFKAITVCVNAKLLDESFVGRIIDKQFLEDLPRGVDPCGENGEFHTFVFDGPIFKTPVDFKIGEKVLRSYQSTEDEEDQCFQTDDKLKWDTSFWYCDLYV